MAKSHADKTTETKNTEPAGLSIRTRFITATSLFDGHDASINIMRRILQSSGAEVIHLGHNRSVQEIVTAAIQEDTGAIAISSYQGGHMEFFKYMIDLLKEQNAGHIKIFGGGGGTILPNESEELHRYGVECIYSPEDGRQMGLQGIIDDMLAKAKRHPLEVIDWDNVSKYQNSHRNLAQALTCLELGEAPFSEEKLFRTHLKHYKALKKSLSPNNKCTVLGVTGTGGAGKSSLVDEILLRLLESDVKTKLAVLAIDPTRRKTGGALLGDRLRMASLKNPRCYMRSLATRHENISVSYATRDAIALLKSAGYDWIIVETGGIGQADTSIVDLVDTNLYVMTSEYGASTQLEKINMLDYADIVALNKFDKPGSLDALIDVRKQFRRNHLEFEALDNTKYPIFGTRANFFNDKGVDALVEHLLNIRSTDSKRQPLKKDHDPESFSGPTLIPQGRVTYLADIAKEVRGYKEKTNDQAERLADLDAVERLVEKADLSEHSQQELQQLLEKQEQAIDPNWLKRLQHFTDRRKCYEGDEFTYTVRDKDIKVPLFKKSLSGQKIRKVVPPSHLSKADTMRYVALENLPGHFPYTAGVFPFKRMEEDPKRMFAGEGTPTRTNRRFHYLCEGEKIKRLSTAFDSVTLYGEDPDDRPDIFGKIGESGVSICSLDDAKKLYSGFNLCSPRTSVSMTINGPAPMMLAFFFNAAIDQQIDRFTKENKKKPTPEERQRIKADTLHNIRGTVQADILKEDQAQNTCIFSTPFALKMMGDIQEYFVEQQIRNFYSVSISGYHIAEAGANPISQIAFTLANGFALTEYYLSRGMPIDSFAPNLSFFFSNGLDAEYSVIGRVARRIWAVAMRYRYSGNDRSQKLKYHIQTSGRSLHAQEIAFNDIRTTLQALLAFYDSCNSLHTNSYDEAVTTPTEESVRRAMAIQLIITKEFGAAVNENPMQGSYFFEDLTDLVEDAVLAEFERISLRGGVLGAMEANYQRNRIQEESLYYERLKHSGELPIIGVNTYINTDENQRTAIPNELARASYEEKREQIDNLHAFHTKHEKEAPAALKKLQQVAQSGGNIFEQLLETARICSLGQMTHALYETGGEYRRSI